MHNPALSDIAIDTLHHAYGAEGTRSVASEIRDWIARMIPSGSVTLLPFQTFGIDDAHQLASVTKYRTGSEPQFVVVTASSITREAQNALLKLFEEPVAGVHFFLIVPSFDILLPTLLSRLFRIAVASEIATVFDAGKFLQATPTDRMAIVEKLLKNSDDAEESKSSVTRMILDSIEDYYATNGNNAQAMEAIIFVRKYAALQGASHKMLLEYLALNM